MAEAVTFVPAATMLIEGIQRIGIWDFKPLK
jgi:hypothetical protein